MELKYIMFDGCLPVIFGEYFQHIEVSIVAPSLGQGKATSAGRLSINHETKQVTVYSKSLGLRLEPAKSDAEVLTRLFFP